MRVIDSHSFVRPRPPKHVTKARENGSKAATTHTVTMKEKIIFETSEPLTLVAPKRLKVDRGTSPSNMKVKARVAWRYVMQHFIDVPLVNTEGNYFNVNEDYGPTELFGPS